jgi:hypothetical protein
MANLTSAEIPFKGEASLVPTKRDFRSVGDGRYALTSS